MKCWYLPNSCFRFIQLKNAIHIDPHPAGPLDFRRPAGESGGGLNIPVPDTMCGVDTFLRNGPAWTRLARVRRLPLARAAIYGTLMTIKLECIGPGTAGAAGALAHPTFGQRRRRPATLMQMCFKYTCSVKFLSMIRLIITYT